MRIISGHAGGLNLKTVPGRSVRPTGDRVKEAIFSVLGDLSGAVVFDLFAGSGALGLEALSRGAADVILVEIEPRHVGIINKNAAGVLKALPASSEAVIDVVRCDVRRVPRRFPGYAGRIDVVLADPPYSPAPHAGPGAADLIASPEFQMWAEGAILVLEHSSDLCPAFKENGWELLRQKRYGDTVVSFVRQPPSAS